MHVLRYRPTGVATFILVTVSVLDGGGASATPPALQINSSSTFDAEELCIAVNPANPSVLAAGANLHYAYRSADAGASWTQQSMTSSLGVWGDPCVAFDADGNLYYAHLSQPRSGGSWLDRIVVQKSIDGGLSWSDGVGVGLNPPKDQDKEWLVADRTTSPYRNNLYMAWTEFDTYGSSAPTDSTRILFAHSTDRGDTWSTPLRVSDRGGNCVDEDQTVEGATPAVGPDGQVYTAWAAHDLLYFDRSLDGGLSFGQDVVITTQPGGWDFAVGGVYRANGLPITACDTSNSPYRGRIYVAFSDQRQGLDDTDVFMCTSDDGGTSWTAPRRINDDIGATHQFYPWLTVDPITGTVAVVYYDRQNTSGDATEATVAVSDDGGATFHSFVVSDASFTPWNNVFFGDYIGIDSYGGVIYAIWMAMDLGDLSVWMARLETPTGVGPGDVARVESRVLMRVPAVATSQRTKISFTTHQASAVGLSIYDLRGRLVRSLVNEKRGAGNYTEMWDGSDRGGTAVASGMYIVRLQAGAEVVTRKVAVVK